MICFTISKEFSGYINIAEFYFPSPTNNPKGNVEGKHNPTRKGQSKWFWF